MKTMEKKVGKAEIKLDKRWNKKNNSPGEHDHKVHDVPAVPQVRALM